MGLIPEAQPREPTTWSALKLLPVRAWLALLGVFIAALGAAATAEWLAEEPQTEIAVVFLTLLAVGLLIALSRLLAADAAHREELRAASERHARDLETLIEARTRELSTLSSHLQELSEKERSELARNLHDELGGLLTAAKMDLSWLQSRVPDPTLQERLAQLGAVLDEAMDLKRRVVEDLRPSLLDHFGLPTALRAYVESVCAQAGLRADIALPEDGASISKDAAIALFRIVQEGLTNIVRHAGARSVALTFTMDSEACRLALGDDGRGFDATDPGFRCSHGITGMRQRVRSLDGRFEIESRPGAGTTLRVVVPRGT
ncbi:MAG TPA: sensor histidine kinase [Steroidobacteraceae bacterium]|nr:sensor histidine kinase [Steroidobacteraceae bacterium]